MKNKPAIELQSIIDAQDNPFALIAENYNIVCAHKAHCETYGISEEEIIGCKCHQVSHHSDVPCHQNGEDCPHKQVFETGLPHQVLHLHYDKNHTPDRVRIKGSPVRGSNGELYLGSACLNLPMTALCLLMKLMKFPWPCRAACYAHWNPAPFGVLADEIRCDTK